MHFPREKGFHYATTGQGLEYFTVCLFNKPPLCPSKYLPKHIHLIGPTQVSLKKWKLDGLIRYL